MRAHWLTALLGAAVAILSFRVVFLGMETRRLEAQLSTLEESQGGEIELSPLMLRMQMHANKLYFAGRGGSWDLAKFYLDELEEDAEEIAGHGVMEGEVNVSKLMQGLIPPAVEELRQAVAVGNEEAFVQGYRSLVVMCNSCHEAVQQSFLRITEPATPVMDNQRFDATADDDWRGKAVGH